MFERFTDRARRVLVMAQEEARRLNHNSIGTEHILLGLIREGQGEGQGDGQGDSLAVRALESLGLHPDAVRQQVEEIIGRGEQEVTGHMPFTARAKKVLELSLRESLQLGHEHIGAEHILLGLLREGDGVAAQVLVRMGTDLNQVRVQVLLLMASPLADVIATGEVESRLVVLSDQVSQLSQEVERLRRLLRQHGIEPGEDTA